MRPLRVLPFVASLCACIAELIAPAGAEAQCNAATMKTLKYDTVFTGTGNDYFNPLIPSFDPSLGDLKAIVIKSVVSIGYGFQVENNGTGARTFNIGVGRNDYIGNNALDNGYVFNSTQKNYGPYTLAAKDGVPNAGPDFLAVGPFSFLGNYTAINDSITSSVSPFLGTGIQSFDYFPTTYSIVPSGLTYTFTASDTLHFSLTYYYCNTSILNAGITDFTAARTGLQTIGLAWTVSIEQPGRVYEIEKSDDGSRFTRIGDQPASAADSNAAYRYAYMIGDQDAGKLYFRLRIVNPGGSVTYSAVRVVDLGLNAGAGTYLYPNPAADFINIDFNRSVPGDWQVDILSISGILVQRNYCLHTNRAHIQFNQKLAAGVYFARAVDQQTQASLVSGFVVR